MNKHRISLSLLMLWAWIASAAGSAAAAPIGAGSGWKDADSTPERVATVVTGTVERLDYDIRWHFLSVGSASIETKQSSEGGTNTTVHRFCVRNHPWARILYRVQDRIESVEEQTAGSHVTRVTKQIREGRFRQDDELVIDSVVGSAKWRDSISGDSAEYQVPAGVYDYVSALAAIRAKACPPLGQTNSYRVAMDKGIHELVLTSSSTCSIGSASGLLPATRLSLQSKSADLCVRNVPGTIWVGLDPATIIAMDVATKIGTVRVVLEKWELDGKTRRWHSATAKGDQNHEGESCSSGVVLDLVSRGAGRDTAGRPDSSRGSDDP